MSAYEVRYEKAEDVLVVSRISGFPEELAAHQAEIDGLEFAMNSDKTKLLELRVHEFSRRIDFTDVYVMFGEKFVRMLAEIQSELVEVTKPVKDLPEPLRSKRIRNQLMYA